MRMELADRHDTFCLCSTIRSKYARHEFPKKFVALIHRRGQTRPREQQCQARFEPKREQTQQHKGEYTNVLERQFSVLPSSIAV